MDRRTALKLLSTALASGLFSCVPREPRQEVLIPLKSQHPFSSVSEQIASALKLGKEFLRQYPRDSLTDLRLALKNVGAGELKEFLSKSAMHDFEVGEVRLVSGFLLAKTEAQFLGVIAHAAENVQSHQLAAGS